MYTWPQVYFSTFFFIYKYNKQVLQKKKTLNPTTSIEYGGMGEPLG